MGATRSFLSAGTSGAPIAPMGRPYRADVSVFPAFINAAQHDGREMLHRNKVRVMLQRTNRHSLPDHRRKTAMNQINEQFTATTRQFADNAAEVNQLALANAQEVFGMQLAAIEQNASAAFAFFGELANVRDADGLKAVLPKGVQVARENVERSISTSQEVFGQTMKTNEAIGQVAKGQFEAATAQAKAGVEKATKAAKTK